MQFFVQGCINGNAIFFEGGLLLFSLYVLLNPVFNNLSDGWFPLIRPNTIVYELQLGLLPSTGKHIGHGSDEVLLT